MVGDDRSLMRVEEAAAMLAISRTRAYALVQSGVIPSVRLGGTLRVPVRQLREWVEQQVLEAGAKATQTDTRGSEGEERGTADRVPPEPRQS